MPRIHLSDCEFRGIIKDKRKITETKTAYLISLPKWLDLPREVEMEIDTMRRRITIHLDGTSRK